MPQHLKNTIAKCTLTRRGITSITLHEMGRKKSNFRKSFENHLGYLFFKLWVSWVNRLPLESLTSYGESVGMLARFLLRKRKKIALGNLHLALGKEKSPEEIERICCTSFKNIGKDMLEISSCLKFRRKLFQNPGETRGKGTPRRRPKERKGAIALTAHLGNFPLNERPISQRGLSPILVARDPENPKLAKMITSLQGRRWNGIHSR